MKNLGKIGLAAGVAAALILLFRKRKDGTRVFDDISTQVSNWAHALKHFRREHEPSLGHHDSQQGAVSRPRTSGRQPGDITE